MTLLEILKRAEACCARLPVRTVSARTMKAYRATFRRMWRGPVLDPLTPGIALDTYYHRRAALHKVSRSVLEPLHAKCFAAAERKNFVAVQQYAAALVRFLDRVEPALERDPPPAQGASSFQSPSSRWRALPGPHPKRGRKSKKHVLGLLPADWDEQLWQAASEEWNDPVDQRELDALAIALLAPVRPEEFIPGERPHGWSDGVVVERRSAHRLDITVDHVKSHNGSYGTGISTTKIDPTKMGGAAAYLAARCAETGGHLLITIRSKNASRKKWALLGRHALPECDVTITCLVCRHQALADFKATLGAGAEVAVAAGHCTDRTQAKYGYAAHGRKLKGLIGVESPRTPRAGNVARGKQLAAKRRLKSSKASDDESEPNV